jgi:hypothetical protein
MVNRATFALAALVIAPLSIATWILASFTVGESVSPRNSNLIGFGIALLAVALLAYLFFFSRAAERPGSHLGAVLIICGTLCVLVALALQFYLASLSAENSRRIAEIMGERLKTNPSVNVNLKSDYPESVISIAYFALFAGIWLAAVGIKVGVVPSGPARAAAEGPLRESPSPA